VTVLLPIFYEHIIVGHISCLLTPSQAKLTGSSWVAQVLELVCMLVLCYSFFVLFTLYVSFIITFNVKQFWIRKLVKHKLSQCVLLLFV